MDNIEEFFHLYAFEKAKNAFGNNCRGNGKIASLVRIEKEKEESLFFHISIFVRKLDKIFWLFFGKVWTTIFYFTKWK